jgi:hypothetical protein
MSSIDEMMAQDSTREVVKVSKETSIGLASVEVHPMSLLVECAESLLEENPRALACDKSVCLSCAIVAS